MTIKRINGSYPIKYEVTNATESEFVQIFKWIESQEVPQTVVDEAIFLERLVNYIIANFSEKSIDQKNYFLAVIDLLRLADIAVNNQNLKLSNVYMSSIDQFSFCFDYDILKDPVISLLENNFIYQAVLIISFYSNLGFGTYEAAGGYDGPAEDVRLEYLEYLVTMNVKDVDELRPTLKNVIPEINSGEDVNYGKNRKFLVSELAIELIKLKNSGLKSIPKVSVRGVIYGIFNGSIISNDLKDINIKQKLKVDSNYENIYEELDYTLFTINRELDSDGFDPILRDILSEGKKEIYSDNNKGPSESNEYKTLIDMLVKVVELSVKDNYENEEFVESVSNMINNCMSIINSQEFINEYKTRLNTLGIEVSENLRTDNPDNYADKPKAQWFKKIFSRS
jgi:hypothetical protein